MDIPEKLQLYHTITNEDGKSFAHEGYEIAYCCKCGRGYMRAKGARFSTECGNPDCGKAKV